MDKYLYLSIDLLTVLVPFMASFYPKAPFYKKWKYLVPAILVPAIIFILWDEIFARMNVWGFNEKYLTGIYLGSLPLEEILFFVCIPYASVFTYFALNYLIEKDFLFPYQKHLSGIFVFLLLAVGMYYFDRWYTVVTFVLLGLVLGFQRWVLKPRYMGRFYFAYAVILLPFVFVNGVLTGSFIEKKVVWYNDAENLGLRLGTIPIEDIFYGMFLILLNVMIYEWLQTRKKAET